jgi:polyhydroxybutyrate depolymerase
MQFLRLDCKVDAMKLMATFTLMVAAMTLATPSAFAAETMTWKVGNDTRQAIVYAPTASPTAKAPLVMSFHGRGDDMDNFQHTDMHRAWPEAIVVYFDGLTSPGRLRGWQGEKGQDNDRDLALVDTALASLRKKFSVDEARIYATGFSNGANFTYLLWAERPGVFAAYAPVAARLQPSVHLTQPRPVFHTAGRADPQILFTEQQAAIEAAIRANGVAGAGASCGGKECTLYGGGSAAPVMTWIHTGGHIYPRGTSERIAQFFRDHPRKP